MVFRVHLPPLKSTSALRFQESPIGSVPVLSYFPQQEGVEAYCTFRQYSFITPHTEIHHMVPSDRNTARSDHNSDSEHSRDR